MKCRDHEINNGLKQTEYLIHYAGWNSRWDEWVAADRLQVLDDDAQKAIEDDKQKIKGIRQKATPRPKDETPESSEESSESEEEKEFSPSPTMSELSYTERIVIRRRKPNGKWGPREKV